MNRCTECEFSYPFAGIPSCFYNGLGAVASQFLQSLVFLQRFPGLYIVVNSVSLRGKEVASYATILLMYSPVVLSSLWPNNIPLYGGIRFYSFIHQLTDIGLFLLFDYYE